jgi:hypothetical protein
MARLRRRHAALLAAALLTLPPAPGCADGKPPVDTSRTEATVSGTVTVRGRPAEGGVILFNPSNSERIVATRSAPIGKDGRYTITTYTGGNQVTFDGDVAAKNRGVGLLREFVDVQAGENKADFDLMGEGGGKRPAFPLPKGAGPKGRPAP